MKTIVYLLLILCTVRFGYSQRTVAKDWVIVPGNRVGPIKGQTSEKDLVRIFGQKNVRQADIEIGEGETEPGTILFPDDQTKTAFVFWRDTTTRESPKTVSIRNKGTLWKTNKGITIETSLMAIEELNGKPFTLMGFDWDYGGTIVDCNGGRLIELGSNGQAKTLVLRLTPSNSLRLLPEYQSVSGESDFTSDNVAMKKLNPRVYEMIVSLR